MSFIKNRINAIGYALSGLWFAFKNEVHLKLFLLIAFLVISLGFYVGLTKTEWVAVLFCVAAVLILELFNSAIEKLCDLVSPDLHPKIKYIKDVMAAGVLLACVFAMIIGAMVFIPYF